MMEPPEAEVGLRGQEVREASAATEANAVTRDHIEALVARTEDISEAGVQAPPVLSNLPIKIFFLVFLVILYLYSIIVFFFM
jgi:hypothetical protein